MTDEEVVCKHEAVLNYYSTLLQRPYSKALHRRIKSAYVRLYRYTYVKLVRESRTDPNPKIPLLLKILESDWKPLI